MSDEYVPSDDVDLGVRKNANGVDNDIADYVNWLQPKNIGQRVAMELTLQNRRDSGKRVCLDRD